MRTHRRAFRAASILLAALLASSCDNSFGIFQGVQNEKAQIGTKVFQKTQVKTAFRLGSYYYAVTQSLNTKAVGASGWTKVNIPASNATYTLRSAVLAGSTIYALTETGDAGSLTIALYDSIDGKTWTAVAGLPALTPGANQSFRLDALFSANGKLYVEGHMYTTSSSTSGPSAYSLWYYTGAAFTQVVGLGSAFAPTTDKTIRGVVWDGSKYWFASEDLLFSSLAAGAADGSDATSAAASFTGLSTKSISDISYTTGIVGASALYIATTDGNLYQGTTLNTRPVASIPITKVVQVPSTTAGIDIILAGTNAIGTTPAQGYYEGVFNAMVLGSGSSIVALNPSIYSTTVSSFPVHDFLYDGNAAAGTLFVCISPGTTSNKFYGLYSSAWDASTKTWSGWSAE